MTPPGLASPKPSDAFLSGPDSVELQPLSRRPASPDTRTVSPFRLSSSSSEPFDLDDADISDADDWQLLGGRKQPLAARSHAGLAAMGRAYATNEIGLRDEKDIRNFEMGAVAASMLDRKSGASGEELREMYGSIEGLEEGELSALVREGTHKWRQPMMLYYVVVSAFCFAGPEVCGVVLTVLQFVLFARLSRGWVCLRF
ncbi:hypothetical protein IMZ48_26110 [Candidatus Bathyarchaeota archaeon]|nr:hypothetical protein [Candidatus Bathyarchaeota archaeon]